MSTEPTRYDDGTWNGRVRREAARVERELAAEKGALARLEAELRAEGRDVEALKGHSAESLLYTVLASRDARLARERDEYLRDRARHDALTRRVAALRGELAELRREAEAPTAPDRAVAWLRQVTRGLVEPRPSLTPGWMGS